MSQADESVPIQQPKEGEAEESPGIMIGDQEPAQQPDEGQVAVLESTTQPPENFGQFQEGFASVRPSAIVDGKIHYDYGNGCIVHLQAGEMDGIDWMDIFIKIPIDPVDMFQVTRKLLQSNMAMAAATPIPTWFAMDEEDNIFFVNRLDWRHVTYAVLDDHIVRCVDQMREALLSEGVRVKPELPEELAQ
ncbi:expressed unknown protein [Seminavis robusta]|uniref:Uncharacterized protein n=1 Tax=Seminavis robusta TaxID=568900 RepID=A0A9N8DUL1_9STRA|nr:expressed unknown protein [Seminavis robusta]|eukprot:Sro369_g128160.1 n/a (190) ;mRNA; r:24800-25369